MDSIKRSAIRAEFDFEKAFAHICAIAGINKQEQNSLRHEIFTIAQQSGVSAEEAACGLKEMITRLNS